MPQPSYKGRALRQTAEQADALHRPRDSLEMRPALIGEGQPVRTSD